jgi:hypothetical protein
VAVFQREGRKLLDAFVSTFTLRGPSSFSDRRSFLRAGVKNPKGKWKCYLEV